MIAIIGIDGAGKSTQVAAVRDELVTRGHRVTELPNERLQPLWQRLDDLARSSGEGIEDFFGADTIQMLASAIKWISIEKAWRALNGFGGVVLADRYSYCHVAIAQRAGERTRAAIECLYGDFPAPDVCIWLDVEPETALQRVQRRGERWRDLAFLEAHRQGYAELADRHDFIVVDGSRPAPEITGRILKEIHQALPELFHTQKLV